MSENKDNCKPSLTGNTKLGTMNTNDNYKHEGIF